MEFIEIYELLQEAWLPDTTADATTQAITLRLPRRSTPVLDISVWVECYCLMASVLGARYPASASNLWAYLQRIVRCACTFDGHSWVTYDRLYRRQAAASRTLNWAVEDQTLYNEAFSGRAKPVARCKPLLSASANTPSAVAHPDVVSAFITNEHRLNRILGPLPESVARLVQCNRLGVVPKGHTPGKWRLITDLSFPSGRSVNDGIDPTLCSLSYVSVDTMSAIISALGTGSLLAKIDIEAAYRLVPVHSDDRPLLGLRWNGEVYCDAMLHLV
ncbi:hypothetical protein EMCRGX_G031557 [Ephydatia muelleri]